MRATRMEAGVKSPESRQPATRTKAAAVASPTRRQKPAAESSLVSPGQEESDRIPPAVAGAAPDAEHAVGPPPSAAPPPHAVMPNGAVMPIGAAGPAPATWGPPDRILIEIAPSVAGGFIGQRYDLEIRGWVVATAPIEEITLFHDDAVVAQVHYGSPGPTSRVLLPDGTTVTRHVFTMTLPRPRSEAGGPVAITVTARTVNNQSHRETFSLMVDPLLPTQVRVESGPTRSVADYGGELPPVVLFIERAALDSNGYLQLLGWVISLGTLVAMQVFAGDERIHSPKLGVRRDDVASVFPSYANALNAGFTLATTVGETARQSTTLRVEAICADGFAHHVVVPLELVSRLPPPRAPQEAPRQPEPASGPALPRQDPVIAGGGYVAPPPSFVSPSTPAPLPPRPASQQPQDPRRVINFFCDVASIAANGEVAVEGWAVCAIGIATVEVWLDNQRLGEAELGLPRDDVGEEYRTIPMARYAGFRFAAEVAEPGPGEHSLRVILRNGLDDLVEKVSAHVISRPKPVLDVGTAAEFRFEIDSPALVDGAVAAPVTGRLTIEGWILARSGITEMQVWLDEQRIGDAYYGLARQDVANAFPDWPNALRSGYAFHCPPRSLRNGGHIVRITARSLSGAEIERSFHIDVRKPEGSDDSGTIRRRMPLVEIDMLTETLAGLDRHPAFHLVLRQNGPIDQTVLGRTFASLHGQVYRDWHMTVLAEDGESADVAHASLQEQPAATAAHVTVLDASARDVELDTPFGAGEAVGPLLVGLLCPGDELGCDALIEIALANVQLAGTDFFYADEVRISPTSHEREPFCKPDFSPDLLLSTNYIGRPWFATPELLARAEVTPRALLRDAEYDIVLRCTEQAEAVGHVAKLLCRRGGETLDSPSAARAALRRAATRRSIRAEVQETPIPSTFRFRRLTRASGKVSIIIPTCAAHEHIETCIRTLRDQTSYRNFEIICIDNIPAHQVGWKRWVREHADKVVDMPDAFNWSRFNNLATDAADGEYLLFLNDDIEVVEPGWLDAMLEHAQRPEVGIVGAQLAYPGGKVQHAGMFLAATGIARHAFRFAAVDEPGYFGLALTQRNVIAVTGACMLVRREVFDSVGRFDEAHEIINNDLDFCLRAHKAGLFTVYTPYARLIHHELASRDQLGEVFDTSHFVTQWKTRFVAGDPFFSPLLSRHSDDYRPDDEPVEGVFAGHPLYHREDIKRILAVKLDHIGDFITALPAMRRLKARFPNASLHVLAARGARAFADMEGCIDGFIEFEFFHTRSGLGQKDLTDEDFAALRAELTPYGFDLAIDLRKHDDTREVLRHVPARFLAGYDHMGQFGFLDIALEWEGDQNLHRKRSHVTDDLINLVEAVATAAMEERTALTTPTWPAGVLPGFLDDAARALFAKPVVAVHPGVGTVMRQWPAEHFAALSDLLIETHDVNILLIGGPDEVELAQEVLDKVVRRDAVVSVTGKTSLAELTQLLACCALYVGNNSGPKHIAAAIGVPTIGVHSGVIDSAEWAPIGKRALALRRNMTCSPCYLAREVDCPRNLACLRQLEPVSVWQACRALLSASRMPVYVTAATERPKEAAAETASPSVKRKPRAGRKQAAGRAAPPAAEPTVAAEVAAPIEPDAAVSPSARDVVDPVPEPAPQAPESGQDREQVATPEDEAAEMQAAEAVTESQHGPADESPEKAETQSDQAVRSSQRPEDVPA